MYGVQSEYGASRGRVRGGLLHVEDKRNEDLQETQVTLLFGAICTVLTWTILFLLCI